MFQPTDQNTLYISQHGEFLHEGEKSLFMPDASSFTVNSLLKWRDEQVIMARDALVNHSTSEIEALLEKFEWNVNELVFNYMSDAITTLAAANMTYDKVTVGRDVQSTADNAMKTAKVNILKEEMCSICAEPLLPEVPVEQIVGNCPDRDRRQISCADGHSFCFSCWSIHLRMQVVENSLTALTCPAYLCQSALESSEWAEIMLGSDIKLRFGDNICRRLVESSADFCWCPAKNCDLIIHLNEKCHSSSSTSTIMSNSQVTVTCGNGHSVCLVCKDIGHAPSTCENFSMWKQKVLKEIDDSASKMNANDVATALWVKANTKACPKCKTPIEKDEGCNHMTCKKCRHDFCWICMQKWENHSNRTGGYFQCNMFAGEEDDDSGDVTVDDTLYSESYSGGSSSKETLRLKKNAAIMDRFIQHYTNYKAQEDSVQLELKMQYDTLHRINDSLKHSASGDLCWLRGAEVQHPFELSQKCHINSEGNFKLFSAGTQADFFCRGDFEDISDSPFPTHFLLKGFRELIKCRLFLKGFFPFSFHILTESSRKNGSQWMMLQGRNDPMDRARADLETLTETLSNIVARKRLRASMSEIERATRAARSQRLEFEHIIINYLKERSNYGEDRLKNKCMKAGRVDFPPQNYLKGSGMHHLNDSSIFNNIEILKSLSGGDTTRNKSRGNSAHGNVRSKSDRKSKQKKWQSHQQGQKVLSTPALNYNDDLRDLMSSTIVRSHSSSSDSMSSSDTNVNIRQVGIQGQIYTNDSSLLKQNLSEFNDAVDLDDIVMHKAGSTSSLNTLASSAEEYDMNKAILLSLQVPSLKVGNVDETSEPPDEMVQSLMAMGFRRDV